MTRRTGCGLASALVVFVAAGCTTEPTAPVAKSTPGASSAKPAQKANANALRTIGVPGHPFQALPSRDGKWLFVTVPDADDDKSGIALYSWNGSEAALVHRLATAGAPAGMAQTHDGALLLVAAGDHLLFVDVARLVSLRDDAVVGDVVEGVPDLQRVYVNVSPDDRFAFVSDESKQTISVFDLAKGRAHGFSVDDIVGRISVGVAPISLEFSPDGRTLYTTSQSVPSQSSEPDVCSPEAKPNAPPTHPAGKIFVVDVARAETDPAHSVVAAVRAGCNPVRLVLSPDGATAYVSARGDSTLLAFDTKKLVTDPDHARIGTVPVGTAPVGVAIARDGARVFVTSSNRFSSTPFDHQPVYVIDAHRTSEGAKAVLGTVSAESFPRELRLSPDGATLFVTNYGSKSVMAVDLANVRLDPAPLPR